MASAMMKVGGVGSILICAATILNIASFVFFFFFAPFAGIPIWMWMFAGIPIWMFALWIAVVVTTIVGISLISIGAFGFWREYGSSFSAAVGIVGIVVAIVLLVGSITGYTVGARVGWGFGAKVLKIVIVEIVGLFWILLGIAFILIRDQTGYFGLSLATGILSIITGAFYCSFILALIGLIMLIPTGICTTCLFFLGKEFVLGEEQIPSIA